MRRADAPGRLRFVAGAVAFLAASLFFPSFGMAAEQSLPVYTEPKAMAPDYGGMLVRLIASLVVVAFLIVLLARGLKLLAARGFAPQRVVKVLEVQRLGPAHLVYLVEVGGRVMLLGGGQGGLALLAELDPEEVAALREEVPSGPGVSSFLPPQDPWAVSMERLRRIRRMTR